MMTLLNQGGLKTVLLQLKKLFATKKAVKEVKDLTDPFILEIDYSQLSFNTDLIVSGDASSPIIGVGEVNAMIIAES